MIIEIDGESHKYKREYDQLREIIIKEKKRNIVRFTNQEVLFNINIVINKLQEYLK